MKKQTPTVHVPNPVSLKPLENKGSDRRVWSIPLAGVWLPYFTAANVMGESNIPAEVLGAPVRLAKEQDGTPRFTKSGRPVMRVVKELSDQVRIVRENFAFALLTYATTVAQVHPEAYKAQVEAAQKAGVPLIQRDANALEDYLEKVAEALEKEKALALEKAQAPAEAPIEAPATERELVPA